MSEPHVVVGSVDARLSNSLECELRVINATASSTDRGREDFSTE